MDFNVRTVTINEHQLFHIPEYVEQIEKLDIEVKKAGVFKMVLEESIRGQGTCLSDLTNVNPNTFRENGRVLASKQFLVKLGTHPMIHGFRSSALSFKSKSSTQMKNGDTFLETIKDSKSYENPTCCSLAVSQSGEEGLLHHFFHNVVPRLEVDVCSAYKVKPLNEVLQQGANDAKAVKEFLGALKALPLHEREKLINQSLSTDSRCETDTCSCRGCVLDDIKISTERDCTKWVAYGSGVRVRGEDHIKMTKHFGLYALASTSLLRLLPTSYTGITSSLLYYGTTHSFFGAHVEDSSLYSINYLHYGHCKIWIVVPPSAIGKFHACIASSNVNVHHTSCHNLLSHKYFFVSPQWLNTHDIPFKVVIQKPGECVVVGPNAIHLGWNAGPNIAEACNFANDTWIPYGIVSPKCSCIGGEVHLDMERVIAATKPHLLEVYRRQGIPVVCSEEDPYFYTSILRVHECNHEHHLREGGAT